MPNIKEIAEQVSKRIYVEDGLLLSKFISEKFAEALIAELAKAEQRVAEACKSMCLRLVRKEKEHAAGYGPGYLNYSAQDVADLIDNGEWRKFVKEE